MEQFKKHWFAALMLVLALLSFVPGTVRAQDMNAIPPTWWFGGAVGANLNFNHGTLQFPNSTLMTPTAFHDGFGTGLYLGALVEYRPNPMWGGILQVGYDNRSGSFDNVLCPCGQVSTLEASISYVSIEPSLRFAPFSDAFYIFAGPQFSFNTSPNNSFAYTQQGAPSTTGTFSNMQGFVFSAQIGVGYDIALTDVRSAHQVELSPFASFHLPEAPRSVESWDVSTVRVGVALKFGSGDAASAQAAAVVPDRDVDFTVRAPKIVPVKRRVRETFPLRNYVYFDAGSAVISSRYVVLSKDQATNFKESQLQDVQPVSGKGRSARQMTVYYNILNIVGDRMRANPTTTVFLSGASASGPAHGKARADAVKFYLVSTFGIDSARITTEGRDKPREPSEQPGATLDMDLLVAGDSRVDIESSSPEMMVQIGGPKNLMLRPVQIVAEVEDPLDSYLILHVAGAEEALASWSVEITDDQGHMQPFGPYTRDQESISGNVILGSRPAGDYTIVMLGQTKSGASVRKAATVHLIHRDEPKAETVRYSILFDFDKSLTVGSYEKFLTEIVTPLIPNGGVVVIHGYTDTIGTDEYNEKLSGERVQDAQSIIEKAIANSDKHGITFETFAFGRDPKHAHFDNLLPEGRAYNRSVIIDIVPDDTASK
jgi:outer membrane protein OmpA-like peptidoglycan-associated protein